MIQPKMKTFVVRLEPEEQDLAKQIAALHETSLVRMFTELATNYAAGPLPPPRTPGLPQSQMKETRIEVPASVLDRAKERAKRENRFLSDVLFELAKASSELAAGQPAR